MTAKMGIRCPKDLDRCTVHAMIRHLSDYTHDLEKY